ncbi:MAG: hypothetical protein U9Q73_01890 [Nanoarchaeota archaeon]|nr:hypothetical protein [Nanoarchaeota archaeon]
MADEKKDSSENLEIRLNLKSEDQEKLEVVKSWYKKRTSTSVIRLLLDEKYQEIKKLKLNANVKEDTRKVE